MSIPDLTDLELRCLRVVAGEPNAGMRGDETVADVTAAFARLEELGLTYRAESRGLTPAGASALDRDA